MRKMILVVMCMAGCAVDSQSVEVDSDPVSTEMMCASDNSEGFCCRPLGFGARECCSWTSFPYSLECFQIGAEEALTRTAPTPDITTPVNTDFGAVIWLPARWLCDGSYLATPMTAAHDFEAALTVSETPNGLSWAYIETAGQPQVNETQAWNFGENPSDSLGTQAFVDSDGGSVAARFSIEGASVFASGSYAHRSAGLPYREIINKGRLGERFTRTRQVDFGQGLTTYQTLWCQRVGAVDAVIEHCANGGGHCNAI